MYLTEELYPELSKLNNQKTETQFKNAQETCFQRGYAGDKAAGKKMFAIISH